MCFGSETFWIAVTALIALASLFTTIHLVRQQIRLSERDLHIRMQLQLDDKFNNVRLIKARKKIATSLLEGERNPWEIVMEFFESMGLLLRKQYLNEEMIWATFGYYIIGWWEASKEFIKHKQKSDPTLYSDFKILVTRIYEIEKREREAKHVEDVTPSKDDIIEFLTDEKELPTW